MASSWIPSWRDRLKACFRFRHRLLQVFGIPAAIGAATAVATASTLDPGVGLSMGMLTAAAGSLVYGYLVTAGFDQKLVRQLQEEASEQQRASDLRELQQTVQWADPKVRPQLERILYVYDAIEAVFLDDQTDSVESILQSSREDLRLLRDRAVTMAKLYQRLRQIVQSADGRWLDGEVQRLAHESANAPPGPVREALEEARRSTERTLTQWRAAFDKQRQICSVLTVIETNLQEFKLAMELRKADVAMGAQAAMPDVTELQSRLAAAGEACDELIGRDRGQRGRTRARRARS
ncbi:MAG: hypothetical protein JW940_30085 [Polyangiaceae bacterium]|nr:hypothetical protein [Polyangiaceae bacterium]